jgi:pseudouridine kinase
VRTDVTDILIVGGANLDITGNCDNRLIPGDSNPGTVQSSAGGVGRNIAENLSRLGFNSTLISAVGQDLGREIIRQSCQQANIKCEHLLEFPEETTGTYVAINNQLGALLAAIADMDITQRLTPAALLQKSDVFAQHSHVVTEANLSVESLAWIADQCQNKTLYVDAVSATKAPKISSILPKIDVLKVNREEASAILDKTGDDMWLAKSLHDKGVGEVLLSLGPQGAILCTNEGAVQKSALKGVNASDTGAGDALFSGFISARQHLSNQESQLEFAIACATLSLNSPSTVNPKLTIELVNRTLADR